MKWSRARPNPTIARSHVTYRMLISIFTKGYLAICTYVSVYICMTDFVVVMWARLFPSASRVIGEYYNTEQTKISSPEGVNSPADAGLFSERSVFDSTYAHAGWNYAHVNCTWVWRSGKCANAEARYIYLSGKALWSGISRNIHIGTFYWTTHFRTLSSIHGFCGLCKSYDWALSIYIYFE